MPTRKSLKNLFRWVMVPGLLALVAVTWAGNSPKGSDSAEQAAVYPADGPHYAPDRVIFKLAAAPTPDLLRQVSERHGLAGTSPVFPNHRKISLGRIHVGRLAGGESPTAAVERLEKDPSVEWAEPAYYRYVQETEPDDPGYDDQWHHFYIRSPAAWDLTTGSGDVAIAVIDTGIDWHHADLADNVWINSAETDGDGIDNDGNGFVDDIRGWDFVSVDVSQVAEGEDPGPPDNDPVDFHGHGTHVSGIAGAVGNNGIGVAGVNWNVSLMGLRVCWANPSGYGLCGIVEIAGALAYAADNGADIVNMSFGSPYPSHTEREAIDYCAGAGVLLVAAAGNSSSDAPHYPAAFDNVMAVAALNGSLARASFSNYGPWVDIAAPGESIYSTLAGGGYGPMAGTSMASPIVAGAAGMVKAYHPAWSSEAIARQLRATAIDLNSVNPYFVNLLGTGLAAVDDALLVTDPRARLGIVALRAVEPISTADGALDPGEIVELHPALRNFGLAQEGVSLTLTSTDPFVSVLDGSSLVGDIGENRIATPSADPLAILIQPDVPEDHLVTLKIGISSAGAGIVATDSILVHLNPLLGPSQHLVKRTDATNYMYVHVLPMSGGQMALFYGSNGFVENQTYAMIGSPSSGWTAPERISDAPEIAGARENVEVRDGGGRIHVVFTGGAYEAWEAEIFHTSRDPGKGTWSTPVQLTAGAEILEPTIYGLYAPKTMAMDAANRVVLVWADYRYGAPEFYCKIYDGSGWSAEAIIATPPAPPTSMALEFDSVGRGYLLWNQEQDNSIYMSTMIGSTWSAPSMVTPMSSNVSVAMTMDSHDNLHLAYSGPNADDVSYRSYDGAVWSEPTLLMAGTLMTGAPILIGSSADGTLHVARKGGRAWPADSAYQFYETVYDGASWSAVKPLTFARVGVSGFVPDLAFDETGAYLLAGRLDTDGSTAVSPYTDIFFVTSDRDATLLPSLPVVTDHGTITPDRLKLNASWSSTHPSGVVEYSYAIGTSPGEPDLRYWTSAGAATEATVDLGDTPLLLGQRYFVSVRARNGLGYWSPAGASDGIAWECVEPDGEYISHFTGPDCTGIESYYTPYDGGRFDCRPAESEGAVCGTVLHTETNISYMYKGKCYGAAWPDGNTLGGFVRVYRDGCVSEPVPACGDGMCNGDETCTSCPGDCPECPSPIPIPIPNPKGDPPANQAQD